MSEKPMPISALALSSCACAPCCSSQVHAPLKYRLHHHHPGHDQSGPERGKAAGKMGQRDSREKPRGARMHTTKDGRWPDPLWFQTIRMLNMGPIL